MPTNSMRIIGRIDTIGTDRDIDDIKPTFYKDLTLIPLTNRISGYRSLRRQTCRWIRSWISLRRRLTKWPRWTRARFSGRWER